MDRHEAAGSQLEMTLVKLGDLLTSHLRNWLSFLCQESASVSTSLGETEQITVLDVKIFMTSMYSKNTIGNAKGARGPAEFVLSTVAHWL